MDGLLPAPIQPQEALLEEVGRSFNVTRERIRQIEAKTLAKLRHPQRSQRLREFLEAESPMELVRGQIETATGVSDALWKSMAELGWLGLQIPEQYQGMGLGFFDLAVVLEQSGRELMPEPFVSTVLLAGSAIALGGNGDRGDGCSGSCRTPGSRGWIGRCRDAGRLSERSDEPRGPWPAAR